MNKELFYSELNKDLKKKFGTSVEKALPWQLHESLSATGMELIDSDWENSKKAHLDSRRACYLSMEFLMGRAVYNNLLCLGITDEVDELLKAHGRSLNDLEEIEDAALGNGGLGRLAACFLDCASAHDLPLDGYGIRYKYGLFKQKIVDGFQKEEAENWTKYGDPWSKRCENDKVVVKYGDQTVYAVPYDMPVSGFGTKNVGTLRLWQAESVEDFDFAQFDCGNYDGAVKAKNDAENISKVLYPNDNCEEGKILRLKQEYFFSSASVTDILKKHLAKFGTLDNLGDYITIQLNDTHPVIAVPELIRQLCAEHSYDFDKAFEIAHKVFNYTNHTIMAEALEKWDCRLVEKVVPEVYTYILMINERFIKDMYALKKDREYISKLSPVGDSMVKMAFMAIYVSSYINGVAAIHTDILKKDALKDWYELYPERFQNKTNGITQRRFLAHANPLLADWVTAHVGEGWITDLSQIRKLAPYADDKKAQQEFLKIKHQNKVRLAKYIKEHNGIDVDPDSIFDVQVKRLHEYKRQLLNILHVMYLYNEIKEHPDMEFIPRTFIFGAKAAAGYKNAKLTIKLINSVAEVINNDKSINNKIKVVFIEDYKVSNAEWIFAAADVSEQISTASKEASGTGNMKFMLNGALTLGTMDGANVEMYEEVGPDNMFIFGMSSDEVIAHEHNRDYDPMQIFNTDQDIRKVLTQLVNGFYSPNDSELFRDLYNSLLNTHSTQYADTYFILADFRSYAEAQKKIMEYYKNKSAWAKSAILNTAHSGKFSSDRTIQEYVDDIWHLPKVKVDVE